MTLGLKETAISQFPTILPHIIQADDVRMLDELQNDGFTLNAKRNHSLALVSAPEQLLHMRQACRPQLLRHNLTDDLDGRILTGDGMSGFANTP